MILAKSAKISKKDTMTKAQATSCGINVPKNRCNKLPMRSLELKPMEQSVAYQILTQPLISGETETISEKERQRKRMISMIKY